MNIALIAPCFALALVVLWVCLNFKQVIGLIGAGVVIAAIVVTVLGFPGLLFTFVACLGLAWLVGDLLTWFKQWWKAP